MNNNNDLNNSNDNNNDCNISGKKQKKHDIFSNLENDSK